MIKTYTFGQELRLEHDSQLGGNPLMGRLLPALGRMALACLTSVCFPQ